ncbi:MAG TPA: hypothetical protein VGG64_18535 [Pirellulales bacterium]|jgi:hypothetical protein
MRFCGVKNDICPARRMWAIGPYYLALLPAVVWASALASNVAADVPSVVAEHLPSGSCLTVFAGDLADLCRSFEQTTIGQTLCGDVFEPLVAELHRGKRAGPLNLQPTFGFDWSDLAKVSSPGGVAVFSLPDGVQGSACLIISAAPPGSDPPCLATAARYFRQQGMTATEIKRASARVTVWQTAATEQVKATRVLFVANAFYGVANSLGAADAILQVKANQSLAHEVAFTSSIQPLTGGPTTISSDALFFLRPLELWESMPKDGNGKPQPDNKESTAKDKDTVKQPDPIETYRRLGYGGIKAIGGRVRFMAAEPCEWEVQARVIMPRPFARAMRLLDLHTGPFADPPAWISANVSSVWRWRWDFATSIKGYGNLFDEANEPGPDGEGMFEDLLDGIRDDPEGVMVDLRKDLFGSLGADMLSVTDHLGKPIEGERNTERTVYSATVRDATTITDALARFYKADERVEHVRNPDYDVWSVPEGASLFVEGESDSVVTVRTLAIGEEQLLFGTDVDLLNVALSAKSPSQPLTDDPTWNRLLKWIETQGGSQVAFWALSRLDVTLGDAYRLAAKEPAKDDASDLFTGLWRVLFFGTTEPSSQLPYATIPPYECARAMLPQAGTFLTPTDEGWELRIGGARAGQEKAN